MKIGIDASNIGGGGGVTHLKEILENFDEIHFKDRISKIIIFSSQTVLDELPNSSFFEKITFMGLNSGLLNRVKFQLSGYDKEFKIRCDILFSITGDYIGNFKPIVGISRNMLLYEKSIWWEIKQPKEIIRFWLNFKKQKRCFKNAEGIIFISQYAKEYISKKIDLSNKQTSVIHHGISPKFSGEEQKQLNFSKYTAKNPFRFLYVSTVHVYKNQWHVVKAISKLRKLGYPVELSLVGGVIFDRAGNMLEKAIQEVDPNKEFINFKGHIEYSEIENEYKLADGIIFASTCENMPNILMESMASGKAIACSDKQPMPEFLKENGFYFNAQNSDSIAETLIKFLENPEKRQQYIQNNKKEIKNYSWEKTSRETFSYLVNAYINFKDVQK
ncbi:MAG: glycosyltransferase family 4 protein [Bacteroidota bacterium]